MISRKDAVKYFRYKFHKNGMRNSHEYEIMIAYRKPSPSVPLAIRFWDIVGSVFLNPGWIIKRTLMTHLGHLKNKAFFPV
jgi:hypothetical protein